MQHSPRFLALVQEAKNQIQETSIAETQARLARGEAFTFIDVREESEWTAGHLPGAIHLGKGILERDIERVCPDPATPIVLYCGGGFRSALAADNLRRMGYTNVQSMDGGFKGWVATGAHVVKD